MLMNRIFRRKEKQEGFEEGSRQTANEYIEADAKRKPGESLPEAVERLRKEKAGTE